MASYEIRWKPSARRELGKLPREAIPRLVAAVEALAHEPTASGSRKLTGAERTWRIRVGDYRIVCTVDRGVMMIEVVRVGHRREVYRP